MAIRLLNFGCECKLLIISAWSNFIYVIIQIYGVSVRFHTRYQTNAFAYLLTVVVGHVNFASNKSSHANHEKNITQALFKRLSGQLVIYCLVRVNIARVGNNHMSCQTCFHR